MISDDSDFEGTSMERLSTSAGSSGGGGKKSERHFWQYNVQAKGPKGQKIVIDTKMDDPHTLNDIVDPVFSGDVQLQGIKHRYVFFRHSLTIPICLQGEGFYSNGSLQL